MSEESLSTSATEIVAEMREQEDHPMIKQHNRIVEIMDETNDSQTYKRARKQHLANTESLCPLCRYHKGENARKNQRNKGKKQKFKTRNF